jgi:hypothetical protein
VIEDDKLGSLVAWLSPLLDGLREPVTLDG